MKLSLNWVKEFVEIDETLSPGELEKTITLSICEVEGYTEIGAHLKEIKVAEVLQIEAHPNAEKLTLVTVNAGDNKETVVCGASNFSVGDKVPFADVGVTLPGDFEIKLSKIRGIESAGMLCAEDELGFSDDHEGLMLLSPDAVNGTTLDQLFPDHIDTIFEIDNKSITHRPDLWGHYGFARELGTIFNKPLLPLNHNKNSLQGEGENLITVIVDQPELVPRYTGLSVQNVKVQPAPEYIRHRLFRVGLRSINNIVDLTNYVMMEYGQPMHAFDGDEINGNRLNIHLAEENSKVMTLYQKEVELGLHDLIICDEKGPTVVAGIIGGLHSGVSENTQTIFFEAANWDAVTIRKTSTKIGIRTDSSQRFEKSLDPEMTVPAIARALELLRKTDPNLQIKGDLIDIKGKNIPKISIEIDETHISRRLGKHIESQEIENILKRLGFDLSRNGTELKIEVPSFRRTKDISIPEDIIEEIGRIHGYNNIPPKAPTFPIETIKINQHRRFERRLKMVLSDSGFHEVYNYPLTSQEQEDLFELKGPAGLRLINPVADNQTQMRRSLLPHFVTTIHENQKISHDFKLFEVGRTYIKESSGNLSEPSGLIMGLSQIREKHGDAFFKVKSHLINLFAKLQIPDVNWNPIDKQKVQPFQHLHISAELSSGGKSLGRVYSFSPEFKDRSGLKEDIAIAEVDIETIFNMRKEEHSYQPAPKYPAVNFEISLLVKEDTYFQEIHDLIDKMDKRIEEIRFLDTYYPKDLPKTKSLSLLLTFRSMDKTMEPDDIASLQNTIITNLDNQGYHLRQG